jgi:hypothetical protein
MVRAMGAADVAVPAAETPAGAPKKANTPLLTIPQYLAFLAFVIFVVFALLSSQTAAVNPDELAELRKLTLFLIGALLPSDALIRFGRNLLFQTVDDADTKAAQAPATTPAQLLAFGVFLIVALCTLVSNKFVTAAEFGQVIDIARVLVIALLPSDAGIRFGRALYYRAPTTPQPNTEALKRV